MTRLCALVFALSAVFLSIPQTANAVVRCQCPTVSARGAGNSSCSASESNRRCTVDFNVFSERERRAVEVLQSFGALRDNAFIPDSDIPADEALKQAQSNGEQSVADVVSIYLMVALANQGGIEELGPQVQSIANALQENAGEIASAFNPPDGDLPEPDGKSASRVNYGGAKGFMGDGCLELYFGRNWVMFKANWSPLRNSPRCGSR